MNKKLRPEKRFYRSWSKRKGFAKFEITVGESDLLISIPENHYSNSLKERLINLVSSLRAQILAFAERNPQFLTSLKPITIFSLAPTIINYMSKVSEKVGVGPMAGVAGAVNYFVGKFLEEKGIEEFIIENGGDIYLKLNSESTVGIVSGNPKIDGKLGILLPSGSWSVCTSSSKIGHSLSLGKTQVATVVGKDPALTDCAATLLGNSKSLEEAGKVIEKLSEIEGALVVISGKVLVKNLNLVRLKAR